MRCCYFGFDYDCIVFWEVCFGVDFGSHSVLSVYVPTKAFASFGASKRLTDGFEGIGCSVNTVLGTFTYGSLTNRVFRQNITIIVFDDRFLLFGCNDLIFNFLPWSELLLFLLWLDWLFFGFFSLFIFRFLRPGPTCVFLLFLLNFDF